MSTQKSKNALVKKFHKINQDLDQKGKDPLKCHGPDHHMRVWQNALFLAKKLESRGKKIDYEVLIPACFLHDITAYHPHRNEKNPEKHQEDITEARKALKSIKYPDDKSEAIIQLISVHGSMPDDIKSKEPIEATMLRDADKMDIMGPLGVTRIFMARARRGNDIQSVVQNFYTKGRLEQKWKAIKIKEARDAVREDYKYSRDFFKRLDKDLST